MDDRYVNINLNPSELVSKYGYYVAAICLRLRGYSLEQALLLLLNKRV